MTGGCTAGGWWLGAKSNFHAFVTTEQNGKWSRLTSVLSQAKAQPGVVRLLEISSESCAGPRNCTVSGGQPAFVVSEVNGTRGKPVEFPGHDRKGNVVVSCAAAGQCTAGWGNFVASDKNGRWGKAIQLPGFGSLQKEDFAGVADISCVRAGDCAIGGDYNQPADFVGAGPSDCGAWESDSGLRPRGTSEKFAPGNQ